LSDTRFPKWNWDVSLEESIPTEYFNIPLIEDYQGVIKSVFELGKTEPRRAAQAESLAAKLAEKAKEFRTGNHVNVLKSCLSWMSRVGLDKLTGIDLTDYASYLNELSSLPTNKEGILELASE
jgi:hypothetical protein